MISSTRAPDLAALARSISAGPLSRVPLGLALLDRELRYLAGNAALAAINGVAAEDHAGRVVTDVLPEVDAGTVARLGEVVRTGRPFGPAEASFPVPAAPGEERWWLESYEPVLDGAGGVAGILATVVDVTDRRRAEAALRQSEARLARDLEAAQILQGIADRLVSAPSANGHFNDVCEAARGLMRSDCASVQAYDEPSARLRLVGHVGFHTESAAFWEWVDAGVGSSCGRAMATGNRVIVPDMDRFEADEPDLEAYRRSGILSVQSTPLVARTGQVVGMMSTHWHRRGAAAEADYRYFDILARLAADFIVRTRAEAALRESEERHAFLLQLSDALRPLADASQIIESACRVLGEHTGADRALYADVSDERTVVIGPNYANGVPPIEVALDAEEFGQGVVAAYRRGERVVFSDAAEVPTFTERDRRNFASIGVVANVSVPLLKDGRWVGVMGLHQCSPRTWTPFEVELVEQTAERVWASIERARAEDALRVSEERYRGLFEAMEEAFCLNELVRDERGAVVDYRFLEVNPAFEQLIGRPAAELVGRLRSEVLPPDPATLERHAAVVADGTARRWEQYSAPLGRWFDLHAFPRGGDRFAVVVDDIGARKALEAERAEQLERERSSRSCPTSSRRRSRPSTARRRCSPRTPGARRRPSSRPTSRTRATASCGSSTTCWCCRARSAASSGSRRSPCWCARPSTRCSRPSGTPSPAPRSASVSSPACPRSWRTRPACARSSTTCSATLPSTRQRTGTSRSARATTAAGGSWSRSSTAARAPGRTPTPCSASSTGRRTPSGPPRGRGSACTSPACSSPPWAARSRPTLGTAADPPSG